MVDGHQVCLALRTTYLSMHRKADAVLEPFGLTANQFVVLSALAAEDGISQRTLVERINSDPNTIRPLLNSLEAKSLVVRQPSKLDGRVWEVKLTRKGRATYAKTRAKTEPFRGAIIGALTGSEAEQFINLLDKVSNAVNSLSAADISKKGKSLRKAAALSNGK